MTTTTLKPSDILRRAAALIEERGLAHGAYVDEVGRLCVVGGIRAACCGEPTVGGHPMPPDMGAYDAVFAYLRITSRCGVAQEWSDAAARAGTPSTVIDGLRRAAELAESEGG